MLSGMHEMDPIEAEAERLAPYPKTEPSHAGMAGFFIVGCILAAFTGFADIELEGRAYVAFLLVTGCAFLGPFIYFNRQKRRHFKVWSELYERNRCAKGS